MNNGKGVNMSKASKWLKIGQVVKSKDRSGNEFESMVIDNENLKAFLSLLKKFGQEKIGNMTVDDIRAAQRLKKDDPAKLKQLRISRFNKDDDFYDKHPNLDFIIADLCFDVEQVD